MTALRWLPCLLVLPVSWPQVWTPRTDGRLAYDEQVLRAAQVKTDGIALVDFFRARTLDEARLRRIPAWIQQLGHDQFLQRETAARELIQLGRPAVPALEAAARHGDPEIALRAERCLTAIAERAETSLIVAALRVLAARKPPGAVEALLRYLPSVADEVIEDEVVATVGVLGVLDGQPSASLAAAARSERVTDRLAAAGALARAAGDEYRATVRRLLDDPAPSVRWRAARALLEVQDKTAVPALIALVGDGPPEIARRADGLLGLLAGEGRPATRMGADQPARRLAAAAWSVWWRRHEPDIDLKRLAALAADNPDFTLLVNRSLKVIRDSLSGNAADRKAETRAWGQAMMIANIAQSGPAGAATPRRAMLRDSALQLAASIRLQNMDDVRRKLDRFPYLQPQQPAPLGKVRILDRHITLDEVMRQFAAYRGGGLEIQRRLEKLEAMALTNQTLPADALTEDLALTGLHVAQVAEVIKEHVPQRKPVEWQQHAENLRGAGVAFSIAVRAQNSAESIKALKRLNGACLSCHDVFR